MDRLEALRADRDRLVEAMDQVNAMTLSSLAGMVREHRAVMAEIAALEAAAGEVGDDVDQLAQRRAARRGTASGSGRPAVKS